MTSPALVSLSDHVAQKRTCKFSDADRTHALPAGLPTRPNWTRFAVELDGASFSHPSMSSGVSLFRGSEKTTESTHEVGRVARDLGQVAHEGKADVPRL